jgi:hypothetical protein
VNKDLIPAPTKTEESTTGSKKAGTYKESSKNQQPKKINIDEMKADMDP